MTGETQLQHLINSAMSSDDVMEALSWQPISTVCDHEWWTRLLGWETSYQLARIDRAQRCRLPGESFEAGQLY